MKYEVFKCNWCSKERKTQLDDPQPPTPHAAEDNASWTERQGKLPVQIRDLVANTKRFVPVEARLHFCGNGCNQAYKAMEAEAEHAAQEAWMTIYNRRKDDA